MLMNERECIENYNLTIDLQSKKWKLPFDKERLNDYEFVSQRYLGKEMLCIEKDTGRVIKDSKELLDNYKLMKNYKTNFSDEIINQLKNSMQYEKVCEFNNWIEEEGDS